MRKYYLRLMGPPGLYIETESMRKEIKLVPASLALLALLGLPGRRSGTARNSLAELMSPGCDPCKSASRLSSAICRLRNGLGSHADHVLNGGSGNHAFSLHAAVDVDVQCLMESCDAVSNDPSETTIADLEGAIESRSGAVLDGIKDHWAEDARQDCAEIYEHGLELLITAYRSIGDVDHSISAARSLIREDPYREDIHAVLLELYGRKGMRGRAASHYDGACEVLREDLGVDPCTRLQTSLKSALAGTDLAGADTQALYAKLCEIDRNMRQIANKVDRLIEAKATQPKETVG